MRRASDSNDKRASAQAYTEDLSDLGGHHSSTKAVGANPGCVSGISKYEGQPKRVRQNITGSMDWFCTRKSCCATFHGHLRTDMYEAMRAKNRARARI